ncbi:MAG: hypothetical protein KDD61_14950, partial [Bdellovibrionales bacterium]|nr:hypothetical protein [Bdellovibrionales bacterium]
LARLSRNDLRSIKFWKLVDVLIPIPLNNYVVCGQFFESCTFAQSTHPQRASGHAYGCSQSQKYKLRKNSLSKNTQLFNGIGIRNSPSGFKTNPQSAKAT